MKERETSDARGADVPETVLFETLASDRIRLFFGHSISGHERLGSAMSSRSLWVPYSRLGHPEPPNSVPP